MSCFLCRRTEEILLFALWISDHTCQQRRDEGLADDAELPSELDPTQQVGRPVKKTARKRGTIVKMVKMVKTNVSYHFHKHGLQDNKLKRNIVFTGFTGFYLQLKFQKHFYNTVKVKNIARRNSLSVLVGIP